MAESAIGTVDVAAVRAAWKATEPIHAMIYFAPDGPERYEAIGLSGRQPQYFASRGAALGPVGPQPVIATFYNFEPGGIRRSLPSAWDIATPAAVLDARLAAADTALRRAFGPAIGTPEVAEAAELAGRAAREALDHAQGRPLFAAHAGLDWPDEPHLALWHAQTLLREFRGDGHVAALFVDGITGIEALVLHAATGEYQAETLRRSRGWSEQEWAEAVEDLRSAGLVAAGDGLTLTETGRARRQRIEDRTDELAVAAYAAIGVDGCTRLGELARPLSRAVVDAGLLPGRKPAAQPAR